MKQALQKLTLPLLRRRAEDESAGLSALIAKAEKAAQSILTGEHALRKSGTGEKFWQFREYDPSDRPQDIDWRQSARGDRVFVRQKERQTIQTAMFWCASGAGMDYTSSVAHPEKKTCAAVITLALTILMKNAGEQVGLIDDTRPPGRTEHMLQTIGYNLIESPPRNLPPASANFPRNAGIVLCGDFLDPPEEIEKALAPLAAKAGNGILIQTLDPAEIDLPFMGRAIFESTGGAERHHIFQVESVKAEYQKRINDHIAAIRSICRKNGWHWLLHRTDTPVRDTLAAVLMVTGHEFSGAGS